MNKAASVDTIIDAGWVIPVMPAGQELAAHSVVVDSGRIVDVISTERAHARYQAERHLRLPGHVVLPGLVNAHTHAAMTMFRGMADDLPLMEWLNNHIWPAEGRIVSENYVRDGTRLAIAEMLRGGTTCFNDMYFFPDVTARVAVEAGMRACVGLIVIDFPTVWAENADDYLRKGLALHDEARHQPLISTAFAPHAPYTVSDEPLRRIRTLADELETPVHIHVHETADEVNGAVAASGQRPMARLSELGLLSPRMLAVHMTQLDEADITLAASHGVHVVHCPESNLKLASGFCPVAQLQARGVNVALGTDGAASNNDLDMLGEMRTAAQLAKAVASDAAAVPAHAALAMATINGARALGLDDEIGSLEPGKAADIIAIDLDHPSTQPVYSPISTVVYATCRDQVTHVWVNGNAVLDNRELMTVDTQAAVASAAYWRQQLLEGGA
ncbi:MAG: TRZ/ATZ family hydrolase [Pseudomonadota bacterium]